MKLPAVCLDIQPKYIGLLHPGEREDGGTGSDAEAEEGQEAREYRVVLPVVTRESRCCHSCAIQTAGIGMMSAVSCRVASH